MLIKRCNMCGKVFDILDEQQGFSIRGKKILYGSAYDGCVIDTDLCCACFDEVISEIENKSVHSVMSREDYHGSLTDDFTSGIY